MQTNLYFRKGELYDRQKKYNRSYIGEKVIKPMYEDSSFPLELADQINDAIEKQIGRTPLIVNHGEPIVVGNIRFGKGVKVYKCGACESLLTRTKYCPECGTLIDWIHQEN